MALSYSPFADARELGKLLSDPDTCKHERKDVRKKISASRLPMYTYQCLECGQLVGNWIPKNKIENIESIQPIDEHLGAAATVNIQDARRAERDESRQRRREEYELYLKSPAWHERRHLVLVRDDFLCQACQQQAAEDVHHLTYLRLFDEPLYDLVAVCRSCHERLHGLDVARGVI